MSLMGATRIDCLSKDNYDTWKLQMKALLIKNDAWGYVSGEVKKEDDASWEKNDSKAHSDIILAIGPSELKQVRGCNTSRELWLKLESTYRSTGPARKAALLTKLTLSRAEEGNDIRAHVNEFFDIVEKLGELDIDINPNLLCVLLLNSLPDSFDNFKRAVKSRNELPTPEMLRIEILEESDKLFLLGWRKRNRNVAKLSKNRNN